MIAPAQKLIGVRRSDAHGFRINGRIPQKLRSLAIRRQSGRAWVGVEAEASPEQIAAALDIDVTNVRRRRAGESGGFAATCEEVYALESAGVPTYALTAHLRSVAMQATLRGVPTTELMRRLDELQEQETASNGALDPEQMRYALDQPVSLQVLRDKAAAQAAVSEEIVALLDELMARQDEV